MILQVKQVEKKFRLGEHDIHALRGVSIDIMANDFLAISGSSGSGKTTLLNMMGCLDLPTKGQVLFEGIDVGTLKDSALAALRAEKIGFVFQTFNLIPVLTAYENVEYPLLLLKESAKDRATLVKEALSRVGLGDFLDHRPAQLSGGQRQRVAIARALVKRPRLILADEPTANLDSKTASDILDLMQELNKKDGVTFVFSSHDPMILSRAGQVVKIADGVRVDADKRVLSCV